MSTRLRLRLYVAGDSPNSSVALANLRSAISLCGESAVELEVIDVLRDPDRGLRDGVLVSPMFVRIEPAPERRVLGTLRDRANLLAVLGVDEVRSD